jgi:hypothetical protein
MPSFSLAGSASSFPPVPPGLNRSASSRTAAWSSSRRWRRKGLQLWRDPGVLGGRDEHADAWLWGRHADALVYGSKQDSRAGKHGNARQPRHVHRFRHTGVHVSIELQSQRGALQASVFDDPVLSGTRNWVPFRWASDPAAALSCRSCSPVATICCFRQVPIRPGSTTRVSSTASPRSRSPSRAAA